MPHTPLFLAALCLTLLTVHAEQVVQTAEVDIAANAHHTFTFETPLTATLLKSVSLVNVAQQGSCATDTLQVSVVIADTVYNQKIGFNNSEWVQFVGTNTSSSVTTVDVTVLNCASRLKAVAVFYTIDPKPVVVSSEPKVIGDGGEILSVTVPVESSYVASATLRVVNLVNCDGKSFEVQFGTTYTVGTKNTTISHVGDTITVDDGNMLQLPRYSSSMSLTTYVLVRDLPSACVANFVVNLDCHHVDIPLTGAPPTAVPTTPWPVSTYTFAPLDLPGFDWGIFFIVLGSGGAAFLIVTGAIVWKYGLYGKSGHVVTGTVVSGVVVQDEVVVVPDAEAGQCEASLLVE